jgi:phage regulator Rha-like protein
MTSVLKRPKSALPFAFTEHGVTMLASVLKSPKARKMNIAIVRAFVALRKVLLYNAQVVEQLKEIKSRLSEHDVQLSQIYDAIENLLDEKVEIKKWEERERIGFKK